MSITDQRSREAFRLAIITRALLGGPRCRSPVSYAELVGKLTLAGGERIAFAGG
jgi:hypothetical protein